MAPPTMPGRAEGTVTDRKVLHGPAPEQRAAHSASQFHFLIKFVCRFFFFFNHSFLIFPLFIRNSRIEESVQNIDDEIHNDKNARIHDNRTDCCKSKFKTIFFIISKKKTTDRKSVV